MFNLDEAVSTWRAEMIRADLKTPAVLDELESHVREEVARQMREGAAAERAFENAVQHIGQGRELQREFAKIGGKKRKYLLKFQHTLAKFLGLPMADPFLKSGDFPASTRQILESARTEALHFHHDFIGTEHVLLGLFSAEDAIVPTVLRRMGIEHGTVRMEVEKIVASQPRHKIGPMIPYTPRARRALRLAAEEAKSLRRAEVGPEHILLGLLREGSGVAGLVLRSLGVNVEKTRAELLKEL